MPLLTELSFLLNGQTAHVLRGAPFQLTKLTASCDFDPAMASWLAEQRALRTALFCGQFVTGTALALEALPALHRVSASPLILACVVPGRPVREVELCLVHPWLLNKEVLQTTIQIVSYSKGPLHSLQIISHLTESAETVLAALEVIPSGLTSLANLALHAVSGSVTNELLAGLPPILAQFAGLKSLMLLSKNRYDALHDYAITRALAAAWHTHCASLECVSLPNATYVRNPKYGWVTLKDLERILVEREQALLQRERDVREREAALGEEQRMLEARERKLEEQIRELKVELVGGGAGEGSSAVA
ncbi:hypothetical protein BV25DRAFT_1821175 [Artomyces pyxidatus]|uniref:Uncharacterized protein n=1 Tax=Artomyces pyxidatus TaxID=48021 RepID=A0ACB8TCT8_9AGAM|nr:hypothetical protein BV25DRAFT_1821175 [Artomyces pyxidatus]